jgi:hypothetical protein
MHNLKTNTMPHPTIEGQQVCQPNQQQQQQQVEPQSSSVVHIELMALLLLVLRQTLA